jgi:pimeloyl-ACP methyl ester carboxylesterase
MKLAFRIGAVVLAVLLVLIVGGYVSLLRPDIPYARLEAKYAGGASRFIDLPGGLHVHYRDQGLRAGPAVVMVHGFAASLHVWEPWVARLGGNHRIVTLDLPGHGLTRAPRGYAPTTIGYADLVDAFARRLKLGPYVVVGNATGGAVAWEDALRHRGDLRGLVLVDSTGWPGEWRRRGEDAPMILRILSSPLGRTVMRDVDFRGMAVDTLRDVYVDPTLVTPALVDRYVELSRAPGHRDILFSIAALRPGKETRADFKTLAIPTLVMHGLDDRMIPYTDGQAFAATIPGARWVGYPGVGDAPMEQIPDRSAADLEAFLDGLDPPGPKA